MRNRAGRKAFQLILFLAGVVGTVATIGCGGGSASAPTAPPPHAATSATSGPVTETGTVVQVNSYGTENPMLVVDPGAPYESIDVYGPSAGSFQAGQRVVAIGSYHSGATNQWIVATSISLASGSPAPSPMPSATSTSAGAIQHIELVMMENTGYDDVVGNTSSMPYINNTLIPQGKLFTNSYALDHPSLPNYLGLYSGSEHGTSGTDACPLALSGPTIGSELSAADRSFIGYAELMPGTGSTACTAAGGMYQGHHAPWIYFAGEASFGQPYNGFPGSMPDVAFIIPDNCHNMHDNCGGNGWFNGDTYLSQQLPAIISWNARHNGLLIVTWDESAYSTIPPNHVATIMVGPMVSEGTSAQNITHYNVLRTITDAFGLAPLNSATKITP